jgi:hypothetical protein
MANPASREQLKQYALRTLGKPVIEINVDDDQLEDRLDEALQYFAQYHYDGVERAYLKYQVTQADKDRIKSPTGDTASSVTKNSVTTSYTEANNYIIVPESVLAVSRIFPLSDKHNQNMFDIRYQLRLNDLYDFSSKRQWGANLSKFNGVTMIGGVTLNGQQIFQEAQEDIRKLEEEIRGTYETPVTYMIG